jgi:hypothetical protein
MVIFLLPHGILSFFIVDYQFVGVVFQPKDVKDKLTKVVLAHKLPSALK